MKIEKLVEGAKGANGASNVRYRSLSLSPAPSLVEQVAS